MALAELRQVLDVQAPPPGPGRTTRRGRRLLLALVTVAAVALALVLALDRAAPRGSEPIVADAPPAGGTAVPGTAASLPFVPLRPMRWPGGPLLDPPGLTTSGPGADAPGTDVQVALDPDGVHLDVYERMRLDGPAREDLTLAAPDLGTLGASLRVEDLQVQLDGVAVPVRPDGATGWRAAPAVGGSYLTVTLRYRTSGGVTQVTPAPAGRELGLVPPLTGPISAVHRLPVQVRTAGPQVLGVSCPTAPQGAVCGARDDEGWTATVPEGAAPVVVLLQLSTTP